MSRLVVSVMVMTLGITAGAHAEDDDSLDGAGIVFTKNSVGLGYDSNVYESNSSAYIDYAYDEIVGNPEGTTVIPSKVQSGFFIPFHVQYDYGVEDTSFIVGVELDGAKYLSDALQNADQYDGTLRMDYVNVLSQEGRRKHQVEAGVYLRKVQRTYYDHDDGEDKKSSLTGSNISNRYKNLRQGLRLGWSNRLSSSLYKAELDFHFRNYPDPPGGVVSLDSDVLDIQASAKYYLPMKTKIKFAYKYWVRNYVEKKARNLDTTLSAVPLSNVDNKFMFRLYNRFGKAFRTKIAADYLIRKDNYQGYGDYSKTSYLVQAEYQLNPRWDVTLDYKKWDKNYAHAYAFEIAPGDPFTYFEEMHKDGSRWRLEASGKLTKTHQLSVSAQIDTVNSTDDRYVFDRQILLATYTYKMK